MKFQNNEETGNKELKIYASNDDTGEFAEETISCEFNGEDFEFGVKHNFFIQSLQHVKLEEIPDDVVELKFNEPSKAFVVTPKDGVDKFLMLNMPVRYK